MNVLLVIVDWACALLLLVGAGAAFIGALGLVRLDDFLQRLHAPTKATTLGVGCALVASMGYFAVEHHTASLHELLITVLVFLTAPVSAQLLVQAALALDDRLQPPPPPPPPAATPR